VAPAAPRTKITLLNDALGDLSARVNSIGTTKHTGPGGSGINERNQLLAGEWCIAESRHASRASPFPRGNETLNVKTVLTGAACARLLVTEGVRSFPPSPLGAVRALSGTVLEHIQKGAS
jgi:hypothetical protein